MHEEANRREGIVKAAISMSTGEGGAEGRGVSNPQEGDLGELDAAVNTFIRFPELRTKNQYTQKVAPLAGAHNQIPIDQR